MKGVKEETSYLGRRKKNVMNGDSRLLGVNEKCVYSNNTIYLTIKLLSSALCENLLFC